MDPGADCTPDDDLLENKNGFHVLRMSCFHKKYMGFLETPMLPHSCHIC